MNIILVLICTFFCFIYEIYQCKLINMFYLGKIKTEKNIDLTYNLFD